MWACDNKVQLSNSNLPSSNSLSNMLGAQPFRPQSSFLSQSLNLSDQQKVLVNGGIAALQQHQQEAKERQMVNRRTLTRTVSCGQFSQQTPVSLRPSALNQHRALQRSSSYDSPMLNVCGVRPPPCNSASNISVTSNTSMNSNDSSGYRSRETGVVEKLLVSYGFIKCADREGRLFFHYSQFHGEAHTLHIGDEIEFEVSMDTRTGKPVAVQVVKLQKGTVVFELLSEDRILGEVTNPAPPLSLVPGQGSFNVYPPGTTSVAGHGYRPSEKGEATFSAKLGSLSYERMGEFFFLHYSANDLTNPNLLLQPGDQVSFNIATEKRTGVMRARKITLVERAPPVRFTGIVTAMKESFGFIERADIVKEIFFHYSEVLSNVPDLHIGDHVEFSIQERNNKDVATEIRLLPLGSVQLEQISNDLYTGFIEKPLPAKAPNKVVNESTIAGGDAPSPSINLKGNGQVAVNGNGNSPTQPTLTLAGVISYITPIGDACKIRFGEKDRAANCLHTLCQGDKVSFLTITDKRNGQQRAAGVTLLLDDTLNISKEKREQGIVAAVKEGFGFIKCVERDSRLFFHCCELLDPTHHVRMSDEVDFTVLLDPVAEKQRMHATRIKVLPKGSVVFHTIEDQSYIGVVEVLPGSSPNVPPKSPSDCLFSPALGPNPGTIVYSSKMDGKVESADGVTRIQFATKDFKDWMDALSLKVGDSVEFHICEVKRTGARSAVDIARCPGLNGDESNSQVYRRRTLSQTLSSTSIKLTPLYEEAQIQPFQLSNVPVKKSGKSAVTIKSPPRSQAEAIQEQPDISNELPVLQQKSSVETNSHSVNGLPNEQNNASPLSYGWVSTLKDTFGFIETFDHDSEIFFHYSEMLDPMEKYRASVPVSYVSGIKEDKACALKVQILSPSQLPNEDIIDSKVIKGKVLKPLKSVNPGQSSYQGLIEYKEANEDETVIKTISYSPLSLSDRRDFIQVGDKVTFQISSDVNSNTCRAANIKVNREIVKAVVDSIKGDFGFINYEVKGGDGGSGKLFFHMSEVRQHEGEHIAAGSLVEFSVIYNQRSGKFSAARVSLTDPPPKEQRPERLRLRSTCDTSSGPTVTVVRQPKGPTENSPGFNFSRNVKPESSSSIAANDV